MIFYVNVRKNNGPRRPYIVASFKIYLNTKYINASLLPG